MGIPAEWLIRSLTIEQAILKELKRELLERHRAGRRDSFDIELRREVRTQGFRIAALQRLLRK